MIEAISALWWLWILILVGCAFFVGYSKWKASQQKDFIVTGSLIGCLTAAFTALGAISAILTIISCVFRLITWKILGS